MSKWTLLVSAATILLPLCGSADAAGTCGGTKQPACGNSADGAAKGQATERSFAPGSPGGAHPAPGMAVKGTGVPQNTTVR